MKLGINVDYDWLSRALSAHVAHDLEQIGHVVAGTGTLHVVAVTVLLPNPLMMHISAQSFLA